MKNTFKIFILTGLVFLSNFGFAQESCCGPITAFVNLSHNKEFKEMHVLKDSKVEKLRGKMKSIKVEDGKKASIYVVPSATKSNKYLFVFHEWWGLNDYIKSEADSWSDKLIDVNIVALDLYDGKVAENEEDASDYMQEAKSERIMAIIEATRKWAGDSIVVATIGWCYGGGWSMQCALQLQESAVGCVLFYGIPDSDTTKLASLNCSVLGIFAKKDLWVNKKVVTQYENAMKSVNKEYMTYWYDAVHAFANPSNKHYDKKMTDEANVKVLEYLSAVFSGERW